MSNQRTTQIRGLLEWLERVALMPLPEDDPAAMQALRKAHAVRPANFRDLRLFCIFVAVRYGRFGSSIFPSTQTMADDFDVSKSVVRRWLEATVALGVFRRTREATRTAPATYEIAQFWSTSTPAYSVDGAPEEVLSWAS